MSRRTNPWPALLVAVFACKGATGPEGATAPPQSATLGAGLSEAPAARPVVERVEPAALGIALRGRALADRGQPLLALDTMLKEVLARVRAQSWSDELLAADAIVATAEIEDLLEASYAWKAALALLEDAQPLPQATPPELHDALQALLARALIRCGRLEEGRSAMLALGVVRDWRVIGPFANERGGGFDTVYAPENGIDFTAVVRGKERDVAWRANPCPQQPLGIVVLDEMLRPNEQAVAYLATAVRLERPRSVSLMLGTSGAFKLWHNGRLALGRKLGRPFGRDQDRVVLALEPGWNTLLVKCGVEDRSGWLATARMVELDGRALSDAVWDSAHAAESVAPSRESNETPFALAREVLAKRTDDATALRLLAIWHQAVHPDDSADKSARKIAERALALQPDDVDTLYLFARTNEPEAGESRAEIRHNERLAPLKRVVALEPTHVGALLDLADFWLYQNPLLPKADEMSARALAAAPQHRRAIALRADVLQHLDRMLEAQLLQEAEFDTAEGRLQPELIAARAHALRRRGAGSAALELLTAALTSGSDDRQLVAARVEAARDTGAVDACFAASNLWLARQPFDVARMLEAASIAEYAERFDDAQQWLERALAVCPEDTRVHLALARIAERRGDVATAERELAEVLRLDPGYDKARRQQKLLAEQGEERFEEPYRWDALTRVGLVPARADANDPLQVVDRTTVWRVEPDGTEHQYEHVVLQVDNLAGVKALDAYWIGYPSDASLQVYNVRVVHGDRSFERAPAPRGGDQSSGGSLYRGFDLPPLKVGDLVDVEYRIDQTEPDVFGQYFGLRHMFQINGPDPLAPVHRAELVVLAPKDVALHAVEHNGAKLERSLEERDGLVVRRWVASDLRRPPMEAAMPDRSEFEPLVDVSTYASWDAFSAWWWNLIEKEFVTTPAMKEKVAELTRGLTTEHDKVRAIARFVGQEIRYNAWSFGTHGYEPYSAATIFERRFGDCKDKSILLRQMLAEIGVEAHPVLINAEWRRPDEKLEVAMVNHFNHCIAYLPAIADRPGYYLDATADRNPIEYLRADDQGAKVLHVRDGSGSVHQIPYTAPADNAYVRSYEVALERDGRGEVRMVDTSNGMFGVDNRQRFGGEQGDLDKRIADDVADAFGKIDVLEARTSKLEDLGEAARVEARWRAENLLTRDAVGANLRVAFDPIPILDVAAEPVEEREWELVLDRPFQLSSKVLYRTPPGSKLLKLPPAAKVSAPGLFYYHLDARATADGIEVERTFTLHERRIPRERYADFRNALAEIRLAESRSIVLEDVAPQEASGKGNK